MSLLKSIYIYTYIFHSCVTTNLGAYQRYTYVQSEMGNISCSCCRSSSKNIESQSSYHGLSFVLGPVTLQSCPVATENNNQLFLQALVFSVTV